MVFVWMQTYGFSRINGCPAHSPQKSALLKFCFMSYKLPYSAFLAVLHQSFNGTPAIG